MGIGGPFPGAKGRPGRDADHSPPSSAEVKNEQELYLLSPQALKRRVVGQILAVDAAHKNKELNWIILTVENCI
jgi:hypothetical protein